jgi:hypothetical protein
MIRRLICLALFSGLMPVLFSQKNDFGIWYNVSIEHDISKKFSIEFLPALRTFDNASRIEEGFLEAGLSYKLTKFLSLTGSYRYTKSIEDDDKYHTRHKWYAGIQGSYEIGDIDLSGRVRFERRYKTYFEDEDDRIPFSHMRFRVRAVYKTPSNPLNPYISSELFFPVNKEPEDVIDKIRFIGGVEYKIAKNHSVDAEYIYQRDYYPKLRDENIISIGYNFKF